MLIFESLEMILLRTASDLSHFSMVGSAIVKKTVSSYMKLVQGSLHSANHRLVGRDPYSRGGSKGATIYTEGPIKCPRSTHNS